MPTLFGKLNARGNKPIQSRYGPGISSTDLANYPPSPSSQDARELVYDPKEMGPTASEDDDLNGHSSDNQILAERSVNMNNQSSSVQPQSPINPPAAQPSNTQRVNKYAEFGAPGLSANMSKSTIFQQPNKLNHQPSSRMHKTLPARPIVQKSSNVTNTFSINLRSGGGRTGSVISPMPVDEQSKPIQQPVPYGYTTIGWDKQMDTPQVAELVLMCGEQIRMRGLTSPLIFSSMALDLSPHNVTSLIRTFLTSPKEFYSSETKFANPHDLAAVIKWALSRLGRVFPVPIPSVEMTSSSRRGSEAQEENVFIHQRGFLEWDSYIAWATYERNADYPIASFSAFLDGLPSSTAALLVALFSLLSSTTSYSLRNGMPPSRLARMFGPLIYGLPEDETFEKTYDAYIRVSNATEHLLLAYIRDMSTMEPLPTRLADHVRGYPSMLASDINRPGRGVRGVPFTLISRAVRLYSVDLVQQGRELDLAHKSPEWAACIGKGEREEREPQLSDRYRKLTNIRSGRHLASQENNPSGHGHSPLHTPEVEAYSSLADKAWEEFLHEGFTVSDPNKLAFNLSESERKARMMGPKAVQWSQFEESGFSLADEGLSSVLAFDNLLEQDVKKWPEERAELLDKIRKTNKVMPPFNYDTIPVIVSSPSSSGDPQGQWQEKPISRMDDMFPEVFADILLGNGWSNRDELTHRNANFVVVQYKSRPNASTVGLQIVQASQSKSSMNANESDDRTDAAWFVIEEVVPAHYRSELEAAGRKKNRSRASLRNLSIFKKLKANSTLYNTGGDSFFDDVFKPGLGTQTKKLTLSSQHAIDIERRNSQTSTIKQASSPLHPSNSTFAGGDDSQHVSSSVRLLTSLKSRASKRLRKANKDDEDDGTNVNTSAPPPPPKGIPAGFVQQSTSWNSDDFDTKSLRDPDLEAFAHADNRRGKMLKTGSRGERRRSKDDSWLDIMVHKDKKNGDPLERIGSGSGSATGSRSMHAKAATEGSALASPNGSRADGISLSSPVNKTQNLSIDVAGWSREEAPVPLTPTRESSLQKLEASADNEPSKRSITPTKSTLTPQTLPRKSTSPIGDQSTSSIQTASSGWTATNNGTRKEANSGNTPSAKPAPAIVTQNIGDLSNASTSSQNGKGDVNGGKYNKKGVEEDDDDDDDKSPTLPYLRSLPNRGEGTEEDREKAREARIEAAKERARELRANLNPVAMDDLERRKEERLRAARDSSSPTSSVTSPAANLRANLVAAKPASPTPSSPTPQKEGTPSPLKENQPTGSRDNPFAKDRFSGRVASLTSKFGGLPLKPITPQSTGNTDKNVGDISSGSIEARLKQVSMSPPSTPARNGQTVQASKDVANESVGKTEATSPTLKSASSSSPPVPPSKSLDANLTPALMSGLPGSPTPISSSPSQWRQRQQAMSNTIDISKSPSSTASPPSKPIASPSQVQNAAIVNPQPSSSASSYPWGSQNQPSSSPTFAPSEIGSRNSIDSNAITADNDSIYPEDAASNFSPEPEEELSASTSFGAAGGKRTSPLTSNTTAANVIPGPSLFSNLGQNPAIAGAAAAAAIANASQNKTTVNILTKEALQAEAQDRATAMPPGYGQRYQPGMPLSNVEEERESVLSGSNF